MMTQTRLFALVLACSAANAAHADPAGEGKVAQAKQGQAIHHFDPNRSGPEGVKRRKKLKVQVEALALLVDPLEDLRGNGLPDQDHQVQIKLRRPRRRPAAPAGARTASRS